MRNMNRFLSGSLASLAILASASFADAQLDVNPPLPNVLLLIDSSGSMESMAAGQLPDKSGATCVPGTATPLNRWATLLTVLTGTIQNFSCYAQDRSSGRILERIHTADQRSAHRLQVLPSVPPRSFDGWTYGPGTIGTNWWEFRRMPLNRIRTTMRQGRARRRSNRPRMACSMFTAIECVSAS